MSALAGDRSQRVELACFAALASLAAVQWATLVSHPPAGRVILAVLLATGAGAVLAAIARLEPRGVRWPLAAAATVAALCVGMVIVGLPARLLLPAHWGELADNLRRSLNGVGDLPIPYSGADAWTRLVILLAAPLLVGLAAFVAFWPTRRRVAGRISALVLLVGLYLVAVAWAVPSRQLAGGALLLVLVCAWLWLPGVSARRRTAALIAVAGAAVIALPAAAALDTGRGLIDYRHWGLLSANSQGFRWDHQTYGPLHWPQKGTLLLEVASEQTHYWKASNLDTFDGTRWVRSSAPSAEPALGEPLTLHPKLADRRRNPSWVDRINLSDRGLSSDLAIGAGTILSLRRAEARPAPDGVWSMTRELRPGNQYTATIYDPKPSAAEMREAGTAFPATARRYVSFGLPSRPGIEPPFWSRSGPAPIVVQLSDSPYLEMYALARRLTAGAHTPYDAARRIELYLRGHYDYRQNVPSHAYPLAAFLSQDRAGYCQQFSGTMALMLRMLGIPSRVSTGFAPGGRDPKRNDFLVDDTDAHDWVEVFFPRIGWVTFEPTPAAAPASTQLDDKAVGVTKPERSNGGGNGAPAIPDQRTANPRPHQPASGGLPGDRRGDFRPTAATVLAAAAGAAALAALAAYAFRRRRRSLMDPEELSRAELGELDRALKRIGAPLPPGATLLQAESLLRGFAGTGAADYAARLRAGRYRRSGAAPPGVHERRALRRALFRAAGRRSLLRVLLAVPPGGPRRPG